MNNGDLGFLAIDMASIIPRGCGRVAMVGTKPTLRILKAQEAVVAYVLYDRKIELDVLRSFLEQQFSARHVLFCPRFNDFWSLRKNNEIIIEHWTNEEFESGLVYGLELWITEGAKALESVERIAHDMSAYFKCRTCCEASRVQLKESPYYSLLFENSRTYLVDDSGLEESGDVVKVVEMSYVCPERDTSHFV